MEIKPKPLASLSSPSALVIGAAAFLLPHFLSEYTLHIAIISLFFVLLASSWNLVAGYTGQISFAHAAFAALGAYASGLVSLHLGLPVACAVVIGTLVAGGFGLLLGFLCIPLGGTYLSLVTLGFSEILRLVLTNEDQWTRGTMGLQLPGLFFTYSKTHTYYLFLISTLGILFALYRLLKSNLGLQFRAVMQDEIAASSLGVPTAKIRVLAFAVSSAIAGFAGALYGHYLGLISPELGSLAQMFLILSMCLIGGLGTFYGPIVGAIFLEVLSEWIRPLGEYHVLVFGVIALVIVRWRQK